MGKSILMSIQPQWVCKILNGEKTIEIRKKFPKDYVGWVYIYCTKGKPYIKECENFRVLSNTENANTGYYLNGKVVARFWCDKVEEIEHYPYEAPEHPRGYQIAYDTQTTNWDKLCEMSCLSRDELFDYLGRNNGYAIHISKLEVFDKPKELGELKHMTKDFDCEYCPNNKHYDCEGCPKKCLAPLTKAPQSYMFIEDTL